MNHPRSVVPRTLVHIVPTTYTVVTAVQEPPTQALGGTVTEEDHAPVTIGHNRDVESNDTVNRHA